MNRRICTCGRKTCSSGDICFKDSDCGYLKPLGSGKRGTCEKVSASYPFTKKRLEYQNNVIHLQFTTNNNIGA